MWDKGQVKRKTDKGKAVKKTKTDVHFFLIY